MYVAAASPRGPAVPTVPGQRPQPARGRGAARGAACVSCVANAVAVASSEARGSFPSDRRRRCVCVPRRKAGCASATEAAPVARCQLAAVLLAGGWGVGLEAKQGKASSVCRKWHPSTSARQSLRREGSWRPAHTRTCCCFPRLSTCVSECAHSSIESAASADRCRTRPPLPSRHSHRTHHASARQSPLPTSCPVSASPRVLHRQAAAVGASASGLLHRRARVGGTPQQQVREWEWGSRACPGPDRAG